VTVEEERVIKKYANRRLYDTAQSRYVALEDIRQLVMDSRHFRVVDAQGQRRYRATSCCRSSSNRRKRAANTQYTPARTTDPLLRR
jgi:hypothetical protein